MQISPEGGEFRPSGGIKIPSAGHRSPPLFSVREILAPTVRSQGGEFFGRIRDNLAKEILLVAEEKVDGSCRHPRFLTDAAQGGLLESHG